jgi:hypothetical protein
MNGLPPLASHEEIEIVLNACQRGQACVSRSNNKLTERLLLGTWQTTFARLQAAVVEHINLNRKVFRKFSNDGRLVDGLLHANVTLYSGLDIYVEMQIKGSHLVILAAHSHYAKRLPQ